MKSFPRLYAILDLDVLTARGLDAESVFSAWVDAGVRLTQIRAKQWTGGPLLRLTERLVTRASASGVVLVVNDRADIARLAGASGVHVGQDDLPAAEARAIVGAEAIVGLSTHNDAQLEDGLDQPVDYLAIGPVFGTTSKARPDPVIGLDGVRHAAAIAGPRAIPLVAIGGITLDRVEDVMAAGASAVAVISDLLPPANPLRRARAFISALGR